ncbi:SART-1 family protein DOT2-like isoform X1 [Actinidia eriantha]|uniref:SART-1 family protein DOT2-like isoform X1 n=1 Tax=Actinidia eriantha TaxID=165200 RepID=UPI002584CD81|nr:SART-1 family protein DOT2-like isoform X1 [Actinidia eriantha]XP_057497506.1 SART-1 family protein DOT2-like isoform X1 [Actinidia eriantha]XP_057497511.1 SART-1 family protein DOT2-like isoform X1 [Actinidia eriantha]
MTMDTEWSELRHERSVEMRNRDDSPERERWEAGYDDLGENAMEKSKDSGKHRSKERSKSSRRDEKDHRTRDRELSKGSDAAKDREKESKDLEKGRAASRERRKDDRDDRDKGRTKDKRREKDYDLEKFKDKERDKDKDRGKEREREREREVEKDDRAREKEREKQKSRDRDKEKEKERDRARDREKEKEREKHKDQDREREIDKDRDRNAPDREKGKERIREKERETDQDKDRSRERDKVSRRHRDEGHYRSKDAGKDDTLKLDIEEGHDGDMTNQRKASRRDEDNFRSIKYRHGTEEEAGGSQPSPSELEQRISKMKEQRLQNKSEGDSEVLSWVNRSRKLEEKKISEKEKAMQLSRVFEEQDNINQGEMDDEAAGQHTAQDLAGVKVLHGLDKVIEGGAVVLTLKDQSILADGGINEEVDMLENVEIGEQKQRDEAYRAAKKKTGIYDDKFNDELSSEKKILPQYEDPVKDEGVTLDASGRFTGDAEKKLEELRRRIQGVSTTNYFEDLNSSEKITSDYYTHEEMLQFKRPKKRKSLRKKEKLDLEALEAEAVSAGLGVGDLGSRNNGKRQAIRQEKERLESEMRSNAYQAAYAKADEASKALRLEQTLTVKTEDDDNPVFGDDDDDLRKSLERARKLSLKKQDETATSGPQAIALVASSTANNSASDDQNPTSGETQENKVVFTEMEEFVWGLQLDEEAHKPDGEDVFMEEDVAPKASDQETKDEDGVWTEVKDTDKEEPATYKDEEDIVPDETIHEAAVGKGLSGALHLLKERGTLKETVEWGGRNMDKKKSKLVGIYENDAQKEIRIERTDEYGRILTPKEDFRLLSHKFHGKGPGKMKQEKRMRRYQEDLKIKQINNSDTPSLSVERMREAQSRLKTPYLVLSGHVKPGQTSDPRSGFATVEKDLPGGLTPMLGDRKVEHFLGIKRKAETGDMGPPKKPKT